MSSVDSDLKGKEFKGELDIGQEEEEEEVGRF